MEKSLVFGLDLGINNVGWAAVRLDDQSETGEVDILAMGTYVFESPLEEPNKATSGLKTRDRGMKRRARRTLHRRQMRKHALYRLLAGHGFLPADYHERVELFCRHVHEGREVHPYALRKAALEGPLSAFELGRVFCHINQRRAFLSPRKLMLLNAVDFDLPEEAEDEETGVILKEIGQTREAIKGAATLGVFLHERLQQGEPVRKKKLKASDPKARLSAAEVKAHEARRFVRADREMMEKEFDAIASAQRAHHPLLTDSLIAEIRRIIFTQRPMGADEGTRGHCVFLPEKKRCPRASYPAQKFALAQLVAGLRIINPATGKEEGLGSKTPLLVAALMENEVLSWEQVKEVCSLPPGTRFTVEPDAVRKKGGRGAKGESTLGVKKHLGGSKTVAAIKKVVPAQWAQLSEQEKAELIGVLVGTRDWAPKKRKPGQQRQAGAPQKPAAQRKYELLASKAFGQAEVRFSAREAAELATLKLPDGYLSVSHDAIRKIMPSMLGAVKDGVPQYLRYDEACERAGFNHSAPVDRPRLVSRLEPPSDRDIRHPLVLCSVGHAVKVLNALRKEFGQPDRIHIELPRDLARSAKDREEVEKQQKENEADRQRIAKLLQEAGCPPTKDNIRKYRLWQECQDGLPYEPDVVISDLKDLCSDRYDIDHIVPRSHSLDSGMGNLTLCTSGFNRAVKANKTPFETLGGDPDGWQRIRQHVLGLKLMPLSKRRRILSTERPEGFTGRHLAATGYISRAVLGLAQQMVAADHLAVVTPGRATSELRGLWGLETLVPRHPEEQAEWDVYEAAWEKYRDGELDVSDLPTTPAMKGRSNYKHHALDALVVALTTPSVLQRVADMRKAEDSGLLRLLDRAARQEERLKAAPDPEIRRKAAAALEAAAIVHRPYRRVNGEFNKAGAEPEALDGLGPGAPGKAKVVGRHLVRYDPDGKPFIAQPLGANHHMVIFESLTPNKKGVHERRVEVVSMVEAYRRAGAKEPVIRRSPDRPGWRFVMALCKGDMVEMEDGSLGVVSKFSARSAGGVDMVVWHAYVAQQVGGTEPNNPYLIRRLTSKEATTIMKRRIILDPLGNIRYSEGGSP